MLTSFIFSLLVVLNSNLTVFVTYFSPFGVERGVGANVAVEVESLGVTRYCITDEDSSCKVFNLPSGGFAEIEALYHDSNPFFHFRCVDVKELKEAEEYKVVRCRRVFAWLPHINAPLMKE